MRSDNDGRIRLIKTHTLLSIILSALLFGIVADVAMADEVVNGPRNFFEWFFGVRPRVTQPRRVTVSSRRPRVSGPRSTGPRTTGRALSCKQIMKQSTTSAPIYQPFIRAFNKCAHGCRPNKVYGTWGCRASGRSCHHSGEAVDIGGYKCGNRQVKALSPAFDKFVKCMINTGKFRKLYRCKDHWDHAHFSYGCSQRKI